MQVEIVATNIELSASQRAFVEHRIEHGLDRFAHEVRTVSVVFSDENRPRGGEGIVCRFKVNGDVVGAVIGRAVDETPEKAASAAVKRAVRQIAAHLDRQADYRRAG